MKTISVSVLRSLLILLLPLTTACLQSVHGDGPSGSAVPGWEVRVLEDQPGNRWVVSGGDRIRVDMVGRYASGEVWGQGPLTLIYGPGTYPGASPPRVGAVIRMQYLTTPNDTTVRLHPFQGGDTENEAYQVRRDRGPVIIEHTVRKVCRPMKVFFLNTGFGPIETVLGCWFMPRLASRSSSRQAELERIVNAIDAGLDPAQPNPAIHDPPATPRRPSDTSRYSDDDGLRLAAREGRPEIVGWLIAQGRDPAAADSIGLAPIHYVGWAQRPLERFVPALERSYLDVLDTLLAHGVAVDQRVGPGVARAMTLPENQHQGQTALGFAAPECADRLVEKLLAAGADEDALDEFGAPVIAGAARNGCPETVQMLIASGADVNLDPQGGGTPIERLIQVSAFHQGHFESARLLVEAGANTAVAVQRLEDRLDDPGPGGFGFSNRPEARRILRLLRAAMR